VNAVVASSPSGMICHSLVWAEGTGIGVISHGRNGFLSPALKLLIFVRMTLIRGAKCLYQGGL